MNAHITKNNNISAGTVARTAVLGLALANQILSACGKPLLPIDSAQLEQWVTAGLTSAAAIWAWWENNCSDAEWRGKITAANYNGRFAKVSDGLSNTAAGKQSYN